MVMDAKQLNRQLASTPEGRMILLEQMVSGESLTGYFALHKIEELVNKGISEGMTQEQVNKEILKVIVKAYNFAVIDDLSEEDTSKTQAIRDLITEQKNIAKAETSDNEVVKKNKP